MKAFKQKISPMLWFDNQAEEAVNFYTSVFPNSKIGRKTMYSKEGYEHHQQPEGALMAVEFLLDDHKFTALNGGPIFKINPSISFFATLETEAEVDRVWTALVQDGVVLMPLEKYDWSNKYGWLHDRFGVSWQIALGNRNETGGQGIVPCLMFTEERCGMAEEAMKTYTTVFKNSKIEGVMRYGRHEQPDKEGTVKHAQFAAEGLTFMAMDSAQDHRFVFNEAVSLVIACPNQEEVDYYWEKLSRGGDPNAQVCGWLKDRYGVSWQVVPDVLEDMLVDDDKEKVARVTRAYMNMQKFDISKLEEAFDGARETI